MGLRSIKRVYGPYTEAEKQEAFERLIGREIENMREGDYKRAIYKEQHEKGWR